MPEAVGAIVQRDGRALIIERSASVRCPWVWSPLGGRPEVSAARWVNAEEFFRLAPPFEGDRTFFRDVWPKLVGHA